MKLFWHQILLVTIAVIITGCGGSDNDSPDSTPSDQQPSNGTDTSAIAGFWDVSEEIDNGGVDVIYALVNANGVVTEYDFDLDAAGSGRDCYIVSTSTLTALGNNQYQQSDNVDGGFDLFTATRQGNVLTVSFVDEDDDNGNGSTDDIITETFNLLTDLDPGSLINCDPDSPMATVPVIEGNGLVVGGFDESRGGMNALDTGAYKASLESYISGVSILTTATLSDEFLNQVDIFIVDVVVNSGTAITRLNLVETAALESFVNDGGGLIVASDNPSFQAASNSFLSPFGLIAGDLGIGGPHTATVIDRTTYSDITDGPFGQVNTVSANNTGSFTLLGEFNVLSNWNTGPLADSPAVVARSDIGSGLGRIVAVADHQTVIAGLEDSEILFLNAVYFVAKGFTSEMSDSGGILDDSQNPIVEMYGVISPDSDANANTFVTANVETAQQMIVDSVSGTPVGRNMDWNPNTGKFYGTDVFDSPGVVHEIDPSTGLSKQIAIVRDASGNPEEIGALAFSPDGTLYAIEGRNTRDGLRLGIVDLISQTFSTVMPVTQGIYVPGIDFTADGVLYAVYSRSQPGADTQNSIVAIDAGTLQITSELSLDVDFAIGDIDLAADGFLYHSNFSYALIQIDPTSGTQENVGFGEVGALSGLASVTTQNLVSASGASQR